MMNYILTAAFCAIIYPYLVYGLEKLFDDIKYIAMWLIYLSAKAYIIIAKWWRNRK